MNAPSNLRALAATAASAVIVVTVVGVTTYQARQQALAPRQLGINQVLLSARPVDSACTALVLSVPPDDVGAIGSLVGTYDGSHRTVAGQCVDVRISPKSAGETADALAVGWNASSDGPEPDVWLAGASGWPVLVRGRAQTGKTSAIPDNSPSFAQSPMVIALPRPMAEALGWPTKAIGFSDLVAIGLDPAGWGNVGHPEWGPLKLGKTSPLVSTSGLHALVATYFAATGVSADLLNSDLAQPQAAAFAKGVELASVHYGESTTAFLDSLQAADSAGDGLGYVSAIAVEERQVLNYNQGDLGGGPCCTGAHRRPNYPLAAVYPKEGTLVSDNPFVVLREDWVTGAKRAVAADLLAFLLAPAQQARLQALGYRDVNGQPGALLNEAGGFLPAGPAKVIKPPSAQVLAAVQASWWAIRKPARVLIIVDISGSMDSSVTQGVTKLELVQGALGAAIDQVGDSDEIGLWTFSSQHQEIVPIAPVKDSRTRLKLGVAQMSAGGGTLLYTTVQDGLTYMQKLVDTQHITAVVVLTDGQDNASPNGALGKLLAAEARQPVNQSVKVFTIGYGADADQGVLGRIATASGGEFYDASNPTLIRRVFNAVLSNF